MDQAMLTIDAPSSNKDPKDVASHGRPKFLTAVTRQEFPLLLYGGAAKTMNPGPSFTSSSRYAEHCTQFHQLLQIRYAGVVFPTCDRSLILPAFRQGILIGEPCFCPQLDQPLSRSWSRLSRFTPATIRQRAADCPCP